MVPVRVMGAAVAHAGHAILQRQPCSQHSAANADQGPLNKMARPGQPDLAHARRVDAAVQEGAHILAVVDLWQVWGDAGALERHAVGCGSVGQLAPGNAVVHARAAHQAEGVSIRVPVKDSHPSLRNTPGAESNVLQAGMPPLTSA